jgi:hypothetical protein
MEIGKKETGRVFSYWLLVSSLKRRAGKSRSLPCGRSRRGIRDANGAEDKKRGGAKHVVGRRGSTLLVRVEDVVLRLHGHMAHVSAV